MAGKIASVKYSHEVRGRLRASQEARFLGVPDHTTANSSKPWAIFGGEFRIRLGVGPFDIREKLSDQMLPEQDCPTRTILFCQCFLRDGLQPQDSRMMSSVGSTICENFGALF